MAGRILSRALLAFLVVLPQGTFRTLHELTRLQFQVSASCKADEATGTRVVSEAVSVKRSMPHCPAPLRFRSWADVTFITKDAVQVGTALPDACPVAVLVSDQGAERLGAALQGKSVRSAHRSPRQAMIAARVLLI
jgi:hypothetical protein